MPGLSMRVEGSGPVALAFALFARRLLGPQASVTLDAPAAGPGPASVAARPLAISHGTRLLIERVAAFPADAAPIRAIDIALSGLPGRMRLEAAELQLPALGWVVRHGRLAQALRQALDDAPAQALPDPAALRVVADGDPGEDADTLAHAQSAVLAEVTASAGTAHLAVERFTPDGPLALLPLPAQPGAPARWSLVWCADTTLAQARAALPRTAFEQALQHAFGGAFGTLALASEPAAVPLARRARRVLVRQRTVWIGNAAQALHPVAGQGLNLGIRDAYELADTLARGLQHHESADAALARYAERRALDRASMLRVTDALARGLRAPLARPVQSLALGLADSVPSVRTALARGFMHGFARV